MSFHLHNSKGEGGTGVNRLAFQSDPKCARISNVCRSNQHLQDKIIDPQWGRQVGERLEDCPVSKAHRLSLCYPASLAYKYNEDMYSDGFDIQSSSF